MNLTLFDLDDTLIKQDSDFAWSSFMIEKKLYDGEKHTAAQHQFKQDYLDGKLDINKYYEFVGTNLSKFPLEQLKVLREEFIESHIRPYILPMAVEKVKFHQNKGDLTILISATNSFIVKRIGEEFNFDWVIATEIKMENNRFTPKIDGTASFREGKVTRIEEWLADNPNYSLKDSWFYSDSRNDLPLLKMVDNPVAVDPDPTLRKYAEDHNWEILSFR